MKALVGESYPLYSKYKDLTYRDAMNLDYRLSELDDMGAFSATEYIVIIRALENTYPSYKQWKERKRNIKND